MSCSSWRTDRRRRRRRRRRPAATATHPLPAVPHPLRPAECPRRHRDDVAALFPGTSLEDMLVIPTCQQAGVDLVQMGERVETEKDRLLERVGVGGRLSAGADG